MRLFLYGLAIIICTAPSLATNVLPIYDKIHANGFEAGLAVQLILQTIAVVLMALCVPAMIYGRGFIVKAGAVILLSALLWFNFNNAVDTQVQNNQNKTKDARDTITVAEQLKKKIAAAKVALENVKFEPLSEEGLQVFKDNVEAARRADDVPRSLPFIQLNVAIMLSVGLRVVYRLHHSVRRRRKPSMVPLKVVEDPLSETVLVVGLTPLTEAYLQSVAQFAPQRIQVIGILSDRARHFGRLLMRQVILGKPEDIATVISDLNVRGVEPAKIIVTTSLASLPRTASDAIAAIEDEGRVEVVYLSERLGLDGGRNAESPRTTPLAFEIT
jgi:hypothetical protein